jgi:ABC-2 type transport system permease protein
MILLQFISRLLAFVGKELVEIIRRPGVIVSLILGPFLIMAVFGLGYQGFRRPLATVVVIPPESGLPTDPAMYQQVATGLEIKEIVPDAEPALQQLRDRVLDAVVVAPADVAEQFRAGQQSTVAIHINVVDPVMQAYAGFIAQMMINQVNARIIEQAAREGATYAIEAGATEAALIPPEVVAAPTRAEIVNEAPVEPGYVPFYGPAVLALILQHLAVTLVALSLVRERTSGVIELFRIAPISTAEVLLGKLLAFSVLSAAISALTVGLLVGLLGVPMEGSMLVLAGVIGLLTLASLSIGLFIAVVSDSERQAVQLSLLVLLASVFFSGFVLAVEEFQPAVRGVSYALPVTHGIRLLQDLMLRGWTAATWQIVALGAIGLAFIVPTWLILGRRMTRA